MRARSRSPIPGTSRGSEERRSRENRTPDPFVNMEANAGQVCVLKELADAVDSAVSRTKCSFESINLTIEAFYNEIIRFFDFNTAITVFPKDYICDYIKRSMDSLRSLSIDHRESHIYVSRLGKAIDTNLTFPNLPKLGRSEFPFPEHLRYVNLEIVHHLIMRGFDTILPLFLQESKVIDDYLLRDKLEDIRIVIREIKDTNPFPVFDWVEKQDKEFDYSELLFNLHKIIFREISKRKDKGHIFAILYAQDHFPQYASMHSQEIGKIMSSLVYVDGNNTSYDVSLWEDVKRSFLKCVSKVLRFKETCQLTTVINIGCSILPALTEIQQRLSGVPQPITYNVKCLTNHHSLFTCPIMKDLSTEDNPPMRLKCGHAISKNALDRLTSNDRLKCPYCPLFQKQSEAKRLYF